MTPVVLFPAPGMPMRTMFFMGFEFSGTPGYRSLFPFIVIKCMAGNPEVKE
jgi:hypothetical protein